MSIKHLAHQNHPIWKISQRNNVELRKRQQAIWAVASLAGAVAVNMLPVERLLDVDITWSLRKLAEIFCLVCTVMAIWYNVEGFREYYDQPQSEESRQLSALPEKKMKTPPEVIKKFEFPDSNKSLPYLSSAAANDYKNFDSKQVDRLIAEQQQRTQLSASSTPPFARSPAAATSMTPMMQSQYAQNLASQIPQSSLIFRNFSSQVASSTSGNAAARSTPVANTIMPAYMQDTYSYNQKYETSPVNELNSPIPLASTLANRGQVGLNRLVDAGLSTGLVGSMGVAILDDWVENLKYILGRHLSETVACFHDSVDRIIKQVSSYPNVSPDILKVMKRLLLLETDSDLLGSERFSWEMVMSQLRSARVTGLDEYMELRSIFCLPDATATPAPTTSAPSPSLGSSDGSSAPSPHVVSRMKWLAQNHDNYLRVELPTLRQQQFPAQAHQQESQQASSVWFCDADIAMTVFLHMCDSLYESTTRVHHRFSKDHFAPHVSSIPGPALPGLSTGLGRIGLVRAMGPVSCPNGVRFREEVPVSGGDMGVGGSDRRSNQATQLFPQFHVFHVHDPRQYDPRGDYFGGSGGGGVPNDAPKNGPPLRSSLKKSVRFEDRSFSASGLRGTRRLEDHRLSGSPGSAHSPIMTTSGVEPWKSGVAGSEVLAVAEGRHNCFEAIIFYFLECIRYDDVTLRQGSKVFLQRMILELFEAQDLEELRVILNDVGVVPADSIF